MNPLSAEAPPPTALLQSGDDDGALWCLPGSDGDAEIFRALVPSLPEGLSVYGIVLTQMHSSRARISVEQLADECMRALETRPHAGPVHLLGYSFGGLLAFEIAVRLVRSGRRVGFVGMVDTGVLVQLGRVTAREGAGAKLRRKSVTCLRHARTMIAGPHRVRWFRETVVSKFFGKAYAYLAGRGRNIPRWLRNVNDLNIFASRGYQPSAYAGRIVLIRAIDEYRDNRWSRDLGWASVKLGELQIRELPGTHRELLRTGPAQLGTIVSEYLMAYR